jgi:hypothetical protein|tara:strand:- start:38 stop:364 length:327 start_codon:yes stop_codon:yes gene_type:complete
MAKWDLSKVAIQDRKDAWADARRMNNTSDGDDLVKKPAHYADYKVEPITFIMGNSMSFWRGNLVKYASRAGLKMYPNKTQEESEITDLRKVQRYCEMRINEILKKEVL